MAKTKGLVLDAILKGVTPKGTKDNGYNEGPGKKTTIAITLDVEMAAPAEVMTLARYRDDWQHDRPAKDRLRSVRDTAADAAKKRKKPADVEDDAWAEQVAAAVAAADETYSTGLRELYDVYVTKTEEQQRTAFGALAGVGVFMALLNQKLSVHFFPSSKVFQPMLASLSDQVKALPAGSDDEEDV